MTTRHLVDPELQPFIDMIPPIEFSPVGLAARRAGIAAMVAAAAMPMGLAASVETIHVPGPVGAPPVRVLVYRPTKAVGPLPALLHMHGGGYVLGIPEMMDIANRELAATLGCAVYSVDYRLAPETVFPGAIEDCHAVLAWLHANAGALGIDHTRIGVKGESAGGGLAAALALLARDRGEAAIAFQHLISPMIDDRTCRNADRHPMTGEFIWTPAQNRYGWSSLLGAEPGSENVSPYAAAARADNLANLAPAYISVGGLDLFLEENMDYAHRLTRAGVAVEFHIYPGAFHGFEMMQAAAVTKRSQRDSLDALRRAMG